MIIMTPTLIRYARKPLNRWLLSRQLEIVYTLTDQLELVTMEVMLFSTVKINPNSEKILAVGSYKPSNVKAEWLDVSRNLWESLPDYPFGMGFYF